MGENTPTRKGKIKITMAIRTQREKYNNNSYCWKYGYNTSDPHSSETCTQYKFGHKNEAAWCNPMGGSHINKVCVRKKEWKGGGGDDHKHSLLNCNGKIYNVVDKVHVCSNLAWSPTTKINQNEKNKIPPLLIQYAQEISWQYQPTWTLYDQQKNH